MLILQVITMLARKHFTLEEEIVTVDMEKTVSEDHDNADLDESNYFILTGEEYVPCLIKNLNENRRNNRLCDISLIVEGQYFPCHRAVLGSSCPYFQRLFKYEEEEDRLVHEIRLDELPVTVMEELLTYMYTGGLCLKRDFVTDIICAADYLLLNDLKEKGSEFLSSSVDIETALSLLSFADQYHCIHLKQSAFAYICRNFKSLFQSADFLDLGVDLFSEIISRDDLTIVKEEEIFEAIVLWINHKTEERKKHFLKLFTHLRLGCVSAVYLRDKIGRNEFVFHNPLCMMLVYDVMAALAMPEMTDIEGTATQYQPRKSTIFDALFVTGGVKTIDKVFPSNSCLYFNLETQTWHQFPQMITRRCGHGAAMKGNFLYIVGGNDGVYLDNAERLDLKTGMWTSLPPIRTARWGGGLVIEDGKIHIMGGIDLEGDAIRDVEVFDPSMNNWDSGTSMIRARFSPAVVTCQGCVYVIGGKGDKREALNSVERYDVKGKIWRLVTSMKENRIAPGAEVIGTKIYVFGGMGETPLKSCEVYDTVEDQWTLISPMNRARYHTGTAVFENHVFVLGGMTDCLNVTSTMEVYDVSRDTWKLLNTELPSPLYGMQCTYVRLSKVFERQRPVISDSKDYEHKYTPRSRSGSNPGKYTRQQSTHE